MTITLSSIVEGVFTTDMRGRITYMNRMAEELSGWKQRDAMGRSIEEVVRFLHSEVNEKGDHPVEHKRQDQVTSRLRDTGIDPASVFD